MSDEICPLENDPATMSDAICPFGNVPGAMSDEICPFGNDQETMSNAILPVWKLLSCPHVKSNGSLCQFTIDTIHVEQFTNCMPIY